MLMFVLMVSFVSLTAQAALVSVAVLLCVKGLHLS